MEITTVLISSFFSILLAIVTAYVSSVFYGRQTKAELRKEFESRFNERKWAVYTDFAGTVSKILQSVANDNVDTQQGINDMYRFTESLWIVGSDRVIAAYNDWLRFARQAPQIAPKLKDNKFHLGGLEKLAQIIIEMRKDLGYTSDRVTAKELLTTFIRDLD